MSMECFEWDPDKDTANQKKRGVSFAEAKLAFQDPMRIIHEDLEHSNTEKRYYCFGKIKNRILTVRFTYRQSRIRIFGAGYWRAGKEIYDTENET